MANYLVKQCSTGIDYVITAGTLSNGDVIVFYLGEEFACGTVISPTAATYDYVYATSSTNCCECQSGLTDSLFLGFTTCEGNLSLDIDGGNFCNDYGLPFTGQVYTLDYGGSYFCATYTGLTFSGESGYTYNDGPFTGCSQCTTPSPTPSPEPGKGATINPLYYYGDLSSANAPLSAGTPTEICLEKCDQSVVSVDPPHPVWTNLGGKAVVELNMVTLGGPFGLNG